LTYFKSSSIDLLSNGFAITRSLRNQSNASPHCLVKNEQLYNKRITSFYNFIADYISGRGYRTQ